MTAVPHPSAAQIPGLYERHAAAYLRDRSPELRLERAWLERFVAQVPPGGAVLDLGCGHGGPIGRWLLERGLHVTGVDTSPTLIATCRDRLPTGEWHVGDMRTLELGRTFDGLLAWDSFFHLAPDDQRRMFGVFRAHAAPGAVLLYTSGPRAGESMGEYGGEPLYHASLSPEEYRVLLADAGFAVLAHRAEDPDCGQHTVWLARAAE